MPLTRLEVVVRLSQPGAMMGKAHFASLEFMVLEATNAVSHAANILVAWPWHVLDAH